MKTQFTQVQNTPLSAYRQSGKEASNSAMPFDINRLSRSTSLKNDLVANEAPRRKDSFIPREMPVVRDPFASDKNQRRTPEPSLLEKSVDTNQRNAKNSSSVSQLRNNEGGGSKAPSTKNVKEVIGNEAFIQSKVSQSEHLADSVDQVVQDQNFEEVALEPVVNSEQVDVEDSNILINETALFYLQADMSMLDIQVEEISQLTLGESTDASLVITSGKSSENVGSLTPKSKAAIIEHVQEIISKTNNGILSESSESVGDFSGFTQRAALDLSKKFDQMLNAYNAETISVSNNGSSQEAITMLEIASTNATAIVGEVIETTSLVSSIAKASSEANKSNDETRLSADVTMHSTGEDSVVVDQSVAIEVPEQQVALLKNQSDEGQTQSGDSESHLADEKKIGKVKEVNTADKTFANLDKTVSSEASVSEVKKEGPLHQRISPTAILEQIKEAMMKAPLRQGERSEMILQLKPEELGKVELKIEVHKDTVIAKFDVSSTIVKETIESSLADLRSSLKDKGFNDMAFDVNVSKEKTPDSHGRGDSRKSRKSRSSVSELVANNSMSTRYNEKSLSRLVGESNFEHYA